MRTTTTSPGLEPIGAHMPPAVRNVADAAMAREGIDLKHPNRVAMRAFLAREIAHAKDLPLEDALAHLTAVEERLQRQSSIMTARGKTPAHLEGLGAWDFVLAHSEIHMARRALAPASRMVAA